MAMFGIGGYFHLKVRCIVSKPAGMAMGSFDRFLFRDVTSAFMNVDSVGMMDATGFRVIERNDARGDHFGSAAGVEHLR
jgi:membrane protein DedA with SNARE-associated domain